MDTEQFKITYNYSSSETYEDTNHWLVGCEIVLAKTYMGAQKIFKKEHPDYQIKNIEIVYEN
jgi:hypothetical protein